jgi:hypothetical protein
LIGVGLSLFSLVIANIAGPVVDTLRGSVFMAYLLGCGTLLIREINRSAVSGARQPAVTGAPNVARLAPPARPTWTPGMARGTAGR